MISYGELLVVVVYAAMAGYIMYLQSKLKEVRRHAEMMTQIVYDIVNNEVEIERFEDGFTVKRKTT